MVGGYQILDLRSIDLEISGSASNITDAYVLKQLLALRDYIDKAYNFNKPLVSQLKPVLVRFRDKKTDEKTEGATFGELSVNGNYYTFKITARISGALVLTINVAFEEITNAYGNKEWVIDTATIQLKDESKTITGDLELTGDVSVGGALSVTGSINGEANPSVKPLYWHGIALDDANYSDATACIVIINNDATPFTITSLKAWIKNIVENIAGTILISIDGNIYNYEDRGENTHSAILSAFYASQRLITDDEIEIIGVNLSTGKKLQVGSTLDDFFDYFSVLTDRVNKLN